MARKQVAGASAQKRSIARRFNDSLVGRARRAGATNAVDRRVLRRLNRFREELKKGEKAKGAVLTPLDIAIRVNTLLDGGERLTDIRKLIKPRRVEYSELELVDVLKLMHPVYEFRPEAYRFAGVTNESLVAAGILEKMPTKRGPQPGSKPSKTKAKARTRRTRATKK